MAARNGKYGVGILLEATNQVSGPAERAGRSMISLSNDVQTSGQIMQNAMQAASTGIAVMAAGLKAMKGLFGIANEAGRFTQEMAAVKVIIGATSKEFVLLEKTAIRAGLQTQFSPLEAAQTMRALAQAGLTATDAMKALRPSLDLAAASLGKLSPERAAQTLNATLKAFDIPATQAKVAMNTLIAATNRYNIAVQDLPIGIGNMSRATRVLNQDMDNSMVALGLVKNVLPNISKAATLTSSAMLRIADATVQKKLSKLGVVFKDAKGNFLPLISIFNNLNNVLLKKYATNAERAAVVSKLLGKQGIAPFSAITGQLRAGIPVAARLVEGLKGVTFSKDGKQAFLKGAQAIKFMELQFKAARGEINKIPKEFVGLRKEAARVRKEAGDGGGAGDLFVKALLGTFRGQIVLLKGAFESFLVAVGKPLITVFKPFVSGLFIGMGKLTNYILSMSDALKNTIARYVVSASAATMFAGAILAVKAALRVLMPLIVAMAFPFLKIILFWTAVGAVAQLAIKAFEKHFGKITAIGSRLAKGLSVAFGVFMGFVKNTIGPGISSFLNFVLGGISSLFIENVHASTKSIGETKSRFSKFIDAIKSGLSSARNAFRRWGAGIKGAFVDYVIPAGKKVLRVLISIGEVVAYVSRKYISPYALVIARSIRSIVGGAVSLVRSFGSFAGGLISTAWGKIKSGLGSIKDGFLFVVKWIYDNVLYRIYDGWKKIIGKIKGTGEPVKKALAAVAMGASDLLIGSASAATKSSRRISKALVGTAWTSTKASSDSTREITKNASSMAQRTNSIFWRIGYVFGVVLGVIKEKSAIAWAFIKKHAEIYKDGVVYAYWEIWRVVKSIGSSIKKISISLWGSIRTAFYRYKDDVIYAYWEIWRVIKSIGTWIKEKSIRIWASLGRGVATYKDDVIYAYWSIWGVVKSIGSKIKDIASAAWTKGSQLVVAYKDSIVYAYWVIWGVIKSIAKAVGRGLGKAWWHFANVVIPEIKNGLVELGTAIGSMGLEAGKSGLTFGWFLITVMEFLGAIVKIAFKIGMVVFPFLRGVLGGVADMFHRISNEALPFFVKGLSSMFDAFRKLFVALGIIDEKAKGKDAWEQFGRFLIDAIEFVVTAILLAATAIATFIGWIADFFTYIAKQGEIIGELFYDLYSSIWSIVTGIASIGVALYDGFMAGIKNIWGQIKSVGAAIKYIFTSIIDSIKNKFASLLDKLRGIPLLGRLLGKKTTVEVNTRKAGGAVAKAGAKVGGIDQFVAPKTMANAPVGGPTITDALSDEPAKPATVTPARFVPVAAPDFEDLFEVMGMLNAQKNKPAPKTDQLMTPVSGNVTLNGSQVGEILFSSQRQSQQQGFIKTTTKER